MSTEHSPYKSKGGPGRLYKALCYSLRGLSAAFRHEAAFRQELLLAVILTPLAFWVGRTPGQILFLIGTLFFVFLVEVLNSALEALAGTITLEHHPITGPAQARGRRAGMLYQTIALVSWPSLTIRPPLPLNKG